MLHPSHLIGQKQLKAAVLILIVHSYTAGCHGNPNITQTASQWCVLWLMWDSNSSMSPTLEENSQVTSEQ